MRLFSALFACVVALAFASPAFAQSTSSGIRTGQQMLDQCTSSRAADLAACDAFLTGAQNAFIYLQDIGQTDKDICVPPGTAPAVLRQVAIDYWRANPGSRKFSAVSSFWNALVARFPAPCV
ncbi:MAG: Rap1a/Tai family immunity protein [Sphingomonas sp.]